MKNYQNLIYEDRILDSEEIELLNNIKSIGDQLKVLLAKIDDHISNQWTNADIKNCDNDTIEFERLEKAQPYQWAYEGRSHLQQGLMFITRAVTQPSNF